MSHVKASHPYYRIFALLTVFTIAEIAWATHFHESRALLAGGLGLMAAFKAAMVALYYMHLKYERWLLWIIAAFPLVLVIVMISGFLPDAVSPY